MKPLRPSSFKRANRFVMRVAAGDVMRIPCGAGLHPAADFQSASCSVCGIASSPIENRPQDAILPHICTSMLLCQPSASCQLREVFAVDVDIFVAAAGEIDDEYFSLGTGREAHRFGYRVRGFEGGDQSFSAGKTAGCV